MKYGFCLERKGDESVRRSITGAWVKEENIIAFCTYKSHKGYLTKKQRKQHKCLKKNCYCYKPWRIKDEQPHPE